MLMTEETKRQLLRIILLLDHVYQKINKTLIDTAEDLDIVMPMHNLLEYSDNYSTASGSLWNYYRDEINNDENEDMVMEIK